MAKTYIDTAQIEMWEHSVRSEYQRERGSRENKQQKTIGERGREEGEEEETELSESFRLPLKHLHENSRAEFSGACACGAWRCMASVRMGRACRGVNIQLFFSRLVSKQTSA